jgi:hypothetical protein
MNRIFVAACALALALPATATAGTYHVYSCGAYANNAWVAQPQAGVTVDATCAGGTLGLSVPAGATMANNTSAGLVFTSPAGTSIADFTLSRQLDYTNAATADHHQYYALYAYGATVFAGAGDYDNATRNTLNAQKQWYGYPAGTAHVARTTVTRRSFPALAAGSANTLSLRVGCFNRTTPCSVAAGGAINHRFYTADVTVNDPAAPANVTVEASGLLAGGQRDGSDPVTVSASDSTGIRKLELIDVTGAPSVVASQDFTTGMTASGAKCDFSRPAPCPNLSRQVIRPASMPEGYRQIVVRVTDSGGNVADRGPFPVNAITPSNRGAFNGTNASDTGSLQVGFTRSKSSHRTVGYGQKIGIAGRLRNSGGGLIGGAQVVILTRDLRKGAQTIARKTVTTRSDGSFSYRAPASASRLLQFAWRSHVNDTRFTASAYLTLNVRASAELHASTKRPRVGRLLTLRGRMRGVDREGVTVLVQGRQRGAKRWETFADTTASRTGAFSVRYRFRASASRGKRFVFRARIRPGATSPYRTGYSNSVTVRVR